MGTALGGCGLEPPSRYSDKDGCTGAVQRWWAQWHLVRPQGSLEAPEHRVPSPVRQPHATAPPIEAAHQTHLHPSKEIRTRIRLPLTRWRAGTIEHDNCQGTQRAKKWLQLQGPMHDAVSLPSRKPVDPLRTHCQSLTASPVFEHSSHLQTHSDPFIVRDDQPYRKMQEDPPIHS